MNKAFHCDPMRFRLWEDILVCFKGHNVGLSCLLVQVASLAIPVLMH